MLLIIKCHALKKIAMNCHATHNKTAHGMFRKFPLQKRVFCSFKNEKKSGFWKKKNQMKKQIEETVHSNKQRKLNTVVNEPQLQPSGECHCHYCWRWRVRLPSAEQRIARDFLEKGGKLARDPFATHDSRELMWRQPCAKIYATAVNAFARVGILANVRQIEFPLT